MRTGDRSGAGPEVARPPGLAGRGGLREALELAALRVPFQVKLAAVWVGVFTILGIMFALVQFDLPWMGEKYRFILLGLPWTILICLAAITLAIVLALLGALARLSRNPVAFGISGFYVSFFRGTPLIVQMFLIYLGLAQIGLNLGRMGYPWARGFLTLDALQAGILALGLNYGAYMTEIFRAGIQSVGHGQIEAAQALGMTYRQVMRRVVLPQAVRVIIPPTGNEFIAMLKDSALVSFLGTVVAQMEIFRRAQLLGRKDFRPLEAFILASAVYWGLTTIFQFFQGILERRMARGYVRDVGPKPKPVRAAAAATGGGGGPSVVEAAEGDEPAEER